MARHDLSTIVPAFQIEGELLDAAPYGSGHINDTYVSRLRAAGGEVRYVHQRINHHIFKNPVALMDNIARVTAHIARKVTAAGENPLQRTLTIIPARDGRPYHRDAAGNFWRTYVFIEGARTYDVVTNPAHAESAAAAFAEFQKLLADLPPPRLTETLPGFHDTPRRVLALKQAIEADACDRAAEAGREVSRGLAWADQASKLMDLARSGAIPERITHNDTKFNNVMIDDATGRGTAVIDLDTVMPGLSVIDFGEMVRTGAALAAEDERDLTKVGLDLEKFERLARGYVSAAREFLTPIELDHLAYAARLMTYENAIRFLTDYLVGDTYFKIHRPGHNLDRARAQFALLADMERKAGQMQEIVNRYRTAGGATRCGPGMQSEPE